METQTPEAPKRAFETATCSRCGGSGHYSYCMTHGTRCFKCGGAGRVYTKRGMMARTFYNDLLSKPASALEVGMKIQVGAITFGGTPYNVWATIESFEDNSITRKYGHGDGKGTGTYEYTGVNIHLAAKDGAHIEAAVLPEKVYRVAATAEQKQAAMVKALDYQDTLTKTGTVRKVKGSVSPAVTP